jgi:hypothetical protein
MRCAVRPTLAAHGNSIDTSGVFDFKGAIFRPLRSVVPHHAALGRKRHAPRGAFLFRS